MSTDLDLVRIETLFQYRKTSHIKYNYLDVCGCAHLSSYSTFLSLRKFLNY